MVEITAHARKRLRQRMGLPARAYRRHVERAWEDGIAVTEYRNVPIGGVVKRYGNFNFIFSARGELITVLYADRKR